MRTFILLNGGAVLAALAVATRLGLHERAAALALGTLVGYLVLVHSSVLLAGLLGHLTGTGVATLVAAMALAACVARGRRSPWQAPAAAPPFTAAALFAPLVAIAAGAAWAWPHVFEATRLWVWDDYTYHMVYPALWLREHVIAAPTPVQAFTMQAWYPLSASIVATWFMVPFAGTRGDALAWVSLSGLLYAGLVAAGAATLARRLGCRRGAWAVPVVLFATSDRIAVMASSFSDADLAQAACLFAALAFAVPRGQTETAEDVRIDSGDTATLTWMRFGAEVRGA